MEDYYDFNHMHIKDNVLIHCFRTADCDVHIPDGITSIGDNCFLTASSPSELRNVFIPDSVTSIGKLAFYKCKLLHTIRMSNNIQYIGDEAFTSCDSLISFYIPRSLKQIGNFICHGENFKEFIVEQGNECFYAQDGVLFDNKKETLYVYPTNKDGESYIVPETVNLIKSQSFFDIKQLKEITIQNEDTIIEHQAFMFYKSLEVINITCNKLGYISGGAFWSCENLKEIRFNGTKREWRRIKKHRLAFMNMLYSRYLNNGRSFIVVCNNGTIRIKNKTHYRNLNSFD